MSRSSILSTLSTPVNRRSVIRTSAVGALAIALPLQRAAAQSATPAATPTTDDMPDDTFVAIPANPEFTFLLSPGMQSQAGSGEAAPIDAPYALAKFLTTNEEFKAYADANADVEVPSYWSDGTYPDGKGDHPVLGVSAKAAEAYCAWKSASYPGWTLRLPTEAELEYASRGDTEQDWPWGSDQDTSFDGTTLTTRFNYNGVCSAWYLVNEPDTMATFDHEESPSYGESVRIADLLSVGADGQVQGWIDHDTWTGFVYTDVYATMMAAGGFTTPVDTYPDGVGPFGNYDLAGNLFEWTSTDVEATNGAEAGETVRAVRGGSWYSNSRSCTATYRGEGRDPSGGYHSVGFRVAASVAEDVS
ncbi:MAG: formylglycine-generating enzyme family protein [Thermomicrobiales bacterium]